MSDQQITVMLKAWKDGDERAVDAVMPVVYAELRRQAASYLRRERPGHTLQATALIHEAYVKLIDQSDVEWQNRSHFFAVAAQAMRRILVDHARTRHREKRGGAAENLPLEAAFNVGSNDKHEDLVALDDALGRLEKLDPRQARVVELRYFSGMTNDEAAEVLGVSNATVRNDWNMAKAWLRGEIENRE